jgi:hypothetical protein
VAVPYQYDTPPPCNEGEADRWEQARRANKGEKNELGKLEYKVAKVVHHGNKLNELNYHANVSLKPITLNQHEINCVTTQYIQKSPPYSILIPCPDTQNHAE